MADVRFLGSKVQKRLRMLVKNTCPLRPVSGRILSKIRICRWPVNSYYLFYRTSTLAAHSISASGAQSQQGYISKLNSSSESMSGPFSGRHHRIRQLTDALYSFVLEVPVPIRRRVGRRTLSPLGLCQQGPKSLLGSYGHMAGSAGTAACCLALRVTICAFASVLINARSCSNPFRDQSVPCVNRFELP